MYAVVVHGGAGRWDRDRASPLVAGVRRAADRAGAILAGGGSALDGVVAAVTELEDDPVFNAGTGSALNLDGDVEMDAGVMDGQGRRTGNVAALSGVRNPVQVARRVMDDTDHVLICGDGALRLARLLGFGEFDPVTEPRLKAWRRCRAALERGEQSFPTPLRPLLGGSIGGGDTVGAVALDTRGRLAAATSTGGTSLKLPGRIGDSPIPGAGNYATEHAAVSATGHGELMLRFGTAKAVCDAVEQGASAGNAAARVLEQMAATVGCAVGLIAVDAAGGVAIQHATPHLPHAWIHSAHPDTRAALRVTGHGPG